MNIQFHAISISKTTSIHDIKLIIPESIQDTKEQRCREFNLIQQGNTFIPHGLNKRKLPTIKESPVKKRRH